MGTHRRIDRPALRKAEATHAAPPLQSRTELRICRFEEMEERQLFAADLHLGAVYFEDATGDDAQGDTLQVTFAGGAPDTELTQLVIDGDKDGNGPSAGDVFFDTVGGGRGAFGSSPLKLLSHDGFQVLNYSVVDGGSRIVFDLAGFKAGMKLVFSIDADEIQYVDPANGAWDINAIVEGGEFQRSQLEGAFQAPGYNDAVGKTQFWDEYDDDFAAEALRAGSTLNLPPDRYSDTVGLVDRTAGAVTSLSQRPLPSRLCGSVYHDANGNGIRDGGETGIAGTLVTLRNESGGVWTTSTDADGRYCFDALPPGTYRVDETQPTGWLDGLDAPGTAGGAAINPGDSITGAALTPGVHADEYNFGELLPAGLRGHVHADLDGDCLRDPGEPGIAGALIELYDTAGNLVATTTTDADGNYAFHDLAPGEYRVVEVQPTGYFDGGDFIGSAGGIKLANDQIGQIQLASGQHAIDYNFCEKPPATISGYVFQDGGPIQVSGKQTPNVPPLRDGVRSSDDTPLAGIVLELRNGITGEPIYVSALLGDNLLADKMVTATTDENGYYQFTGVPAGIYAVYERHDPAGTLDGLNTAGATGGVAIGAWQSAAGNLIDSLAYPPASGDAILQILVGAGESSQENNFSEVVTRSGIIIIQQPPPEVRPQYRPGVVLPPGAPPTYVPTAPQLVVPRYLYGGSSMNYTWHLSVIDGGHPRGEPTDVSPIQHASSGDDSPQLQRRTHEKARWVLARRDAAGKLTESRSLLFGPADGVPVSGDFDGDGITDLAIFAEGEWLLDTAGDGEQDPADLWARLGSRDDQPVTGDWNGDGKSDIGIFGPAWPRDPHAIRHEPGIADAENANRTRPKNLPPVPEHAAMGTRRLRATGAKTREDLIDHVFHYGTAGDVAIAGDWNGDGIDTIGIFRDGVWHRDTDGDGRTTPRDAVAQFGRAGDLPVVGDWNGDGRTDLGIYRGGTWHLDTNGNDQLDADDEVAHLGTPQDRPISGDFDGDGRDEIGIVVNGRVEWGRG